MIARFNAKVEKALREALGSMSHIEANQVPGSLSMLNDRDQTAVLSMAMMVAGYVVIDVCDNKWPNAASVRQIAGDLATTGTTAERLQLDTEQVYAYLSRTVLGSERLEDIIPDEPEFSRLPLIVALQALGVYSPKGMGIWDYLDQIESAIEAASALDTSVLPAAVMRAYLPQPDEGDR